MIADTTDVNFLLLISHLRMTHDDDWFTSILSATEATTLAVIPQDCNRLTVAKPQLCWMRRKDLVV